MKKILAFINIIFLINILFFASRFIFQKTKEIKKVIKNTDNFLFVKGDITNKWDFKDDLINNISINNILAIKRDVYIYQWQEDENKLNKDGIVNYSYSKKWSSNFIDSNKFNDKTKNNYVRINVPYSSTILVPNKIILENKFIIDKKYFIDKINYETYKFKKNSTFTGEKLDIKHKFDFQDKSRTDENYADLDAYVSSIEKKVASFEFDKFNIIDNHILYNGRNYNNPQIGDIKIIYRIFSPEKTSFFGAKIGNEMIPYKNFYIVDFNDNSQNKIMIKYKLTFFTQLFIFINLIIFIITIIVNTLRNTLKNFTIKFIYYFGECIVYTKKEYIISSIITIIIGIISGFFILSINAFLILVILRQIDYYSI